MEHEQSRVDDSKELHKILAVEFEKYRLSKYVLIPKWKAGASETDSIYSADQQKIIKALCTKLEAAVSKLPCKERELIKERYFSVESDYLTDMMVYQQRMSPPVSSATYSKCRDRAVKKLAIYMGLADGSDLKRTDEGR